LTGLLAAGTVVNDVFSHPKEFSNRIFEINPKINNLRVVYIEAPGIMLKNGTGTTFETFSASTAKVNTGGVKYCMDTVAILLANQPGMDSRKAWETIFQKPSNKEWRDVLVAIKPNCAAGNTDGQLVPHASIAIINAVCDALTGLGVTASNITIYDTNGFSVNPQTLYPASAMLSGIKFVGPTLRNYPAQLWSSLSPAALEADIIINIASCKGHAELGGATLTLKNHLGTVGGHVTGDQAVQKILEIHNSEAVLGKPIPGSVPPKQQLAIVDCLWAAENGPLAAPDKAPGILVMGTSCPAVDCFTAIKVRLEKLKYKGDRPTFLSYLTHYGYDAAAVEPLLKNPNPDALGRGWLDASWMLGTPIKGSNCSPLKNTVVTFSITGSGFKPQTQTITLKQGEMVKSVSIIDLKGRVIRVLTLNESDKNNIAWDARNTNGNMVIPGAYLLKISGSKAVKAVRFTLIR